MDSDALRSVRNAFYLALYQNVQKEVAQLDQNNQTVRGWGDVYAARAQVCLNPAALQASESAATPIQAVKQLATYLTAAPDNRELVLDTLKEWLSTPELASDVTLQLVAAHIYMLEGMNKEALKLVSNDAENLEKLAVCVAIYLRMDRVDLASKSVKCMHDVDDDDTLTQLCAAWLAIRTGGDRLNEAAFLLQELIEKFGPSVPVLNALAVCSLHQRQYAQAFQHTKSARELAIKSGQKVSAETLLNSIVALQHLRRGVDIIEKITLELRKNYPDHPWIQQQADMEEKFDKYATTFKNKQ